MKYLVMLLMVVGLYLTSLHHYLLFHSLSEIISVVISGMVFALTLNSTKYIKNGYLQTIGVAYLFIGLIDLLHTLSYKGMGIFTDYDYYANQLWIGGRFIEAVTLVVAFKMVRKGSINIGLTFFIYLAVTSLLLASVFYWKNFPECFNEAGLTAFKVNMEYVICAILLLSLYLLHRNRDAFTSQISELLFWSILCTILSELAFTFYISNYGFSNLVGHYAKLTSMYLVYRAIIVSGINDPFDLIFRELKENEEQLRKNLSIMKQSSEFKGRFIASVSHEIRTPLNGIMGALDVISNTDMSSEQKELIDIMFKSSRSLMGLINNVLDLSKIEVGKMTLDEKPFSIARLTEEVVDIFRMLCRAKNIDIQNICAFSADDIRIGDEQRLRQIMINLVGNAVKFTKRGSVTLSTRPLSLGNTVQIEVSDTGSGIHPDMHEHVFAEFAQARNEEGMKSSGSGLGLTISKKLVELMGGKIELYSELGIGSKFTVQIPLEKSDKKIEKHEGVSLSVRNNLSVLVVEDSPVSRRIMEMMLQRLQCKVHVAGSGREVIELFLDKPEFDIVFLDRDLPDMKGEEICRHIRKRFSKDELPIVAVTASVMPGDRESCVEAGMNDYLSKPIKLKDLSEVLNKFCK